MQSDLAVSSFLSLNLVKIQKMCITKVQKNDAKRRGHIFIIASKFGKNLENVHQMAYHLLCKATLPYHPLFPPYLRKIQRMMGLSTMVQIYDAKRRCHIFIIAPKSPENLENVHQLGLLSNLVQKYNAKQHCHLILFPKSMENLKNV